jgi:hypothetical protein
MTLAATGVSRPALAAELTATSTVDPLTPEQAAAEKFFVQWLMLNDSYEAVRSAARSAFLGGTAAITKFLAFGGGWDAARTRGETALARNISWTERTVRSHLPQYYPRVNAAGRRALEDGSEKAVNEFVKTGYATNLDLDKQGIADDKLRADLILQDDRNFVVMLSEADPGEQVRAWATRAVEPGTDAAIAEFLNYGWTSAAGLDVQTFHRQCADADRKWLATSNGLVVDAQAAEAAARGLEGEAKKQKLAAAARLWAQVGAQTGPPRLAWAEAEQFAVRLAETWLEVTATAAASTNPNWQTIAGTSQGTRDRWLAEQRHAAEQAKHWLALLEKAVKAETELSKPAA